MCQWYSLILGDSQFNDDDPGCSPHNDVWSQSCLHNLNGEDGLCAEVNAHLPFLSRGQQQQYFLTYRCPLLALSLDKGNVWCLANREGVCGCPSFFQPGPQDLAVLGHHDRQSWWNGDCVGAISSAPVPVPHCMTTRCAEGLRCFYCIEGTCLHPQTTVTGFMGKEGYRTLI